MKKILLNLLLVMPALLLCQCSVSNIEFGEFENCSPATGRYAIPVTVTYSNKVETVKIRVTGIDYEFGEKNLKNNHHLSGQNQFTFVIYDYTDSTQNDIWVYADLLGGACTVIEKDSANLAFLSTNSCPIIIIDPPLETCPDFITLSGSITIDTTIQAVDYIISTQVIEASGDLHLGAGDYVSLLDGFHAKAGSNCLINTIGCTNENNGNGSQTEGGGEEGGGNCPKVLLLSSTVSNTRNYVADSLIITNQILLAGSDVTYNAPSIIYDSTFTALVGSNYQFNESTPCTN